MRPSQIETKYYNFLIKRYYAPNYESQIYNNNPVY